jgi:hypothetical protein
MKATLNSSVTVRLEGHCCGRYHSVSFNAISLFNRLVSSKGIQFRDVGETFEYEGGESKNAYMKKKGHLSC